LQSQPRSGWSLRTPRLAFTRHPASPRPHAANEENAALRKAIARGRRRTERGAREGADGPELGLRGALVPVRVARVARHTPTLSVAQERAPYMCHSSTSACSFRSAPTLTSSRSSNTFRRWSTRPSTRRSRRASSSSRPVRGSKRHRRLRGDGELRLPSRLPACPRLRHAPAVPRAQSKQTCKRRRGIFSSGASRRVAASHTAREQAVWLTPSGCWHNGLCVDAVAAFLSAPP